MMKRIIILTIFNMMTVLLTACKKETTAELPNPFVEYETMEEAEAAAGFTINVPDRVPEGYTLSAIRVIENELAELTYVNGEDEIAYRQGKGSEDISGDYTEYSETNEVKVGDIQVTTKGNEGVVNVALWTNGDSTYSIGANNDGKGLLLSDVIDMISSIKY